MLTFLCAILCFAIFFKLLFFSFAFSWGAAKLLVSIICGLAGLIFMMFSGLLFVVIPILAVIGIIHLVTCRA